MSDKVYTICILWPDSLGGDPREIYQHATLLPMDEGHFGTLLFADADGLEHRVSCAMPFTVTEERKS